MFIQKNNKIYKIEDIGTPISITIEVMNKETGLSVMETKENPVYVIKEK